MKLTENELREKIQKALDFMEEMEEDTKADDPDFELWEDTVYNFVLDELSDEDYDEDEFERIFDELY